MYRTVFYLVITIGLGGVVSHMHAAEEIRTLHIHYENDNAFLRHITKLSWEQCIQEKEVYQTSKQEYPTSWASMEAKIKKKRPQYDVDATLVPEPKWSLIAVDKEEEYFAAENYAKYEYKNKYNVSEDGRCELLQQTQTSVYIDDGVFEYVINLTKKKGVKGISPVVDLKRMDQKVASTLAPGTQGAEAAKNILPGTEFEKVMVDAGSETVVDNQTCNYRAPTGSSKTKLCYWSITPIYPSAMERPIILKSIIKTGKHINTKTATGFEKNKVIEKNIFQPPNNIELEDHTSMR